MNIIVNSKELGKAILKKFHYFDTASKALGYSHDGLGKALRSGVITKRMEESLRKYGIEAKDYAIDKADIMPIMCKGLDIETRDNQSPERTQISIDDIEVIKRSELLELIKDALREIIREEIK